eukprot:673110-Prorocentrum_minimum.AAC.2
MARLSPVGTVEKVFSRVLTGGEKGAPKTKAVRPSPSSPPTRRRKFGFPLRPFHFSFRRPRAGGAAEGGGGEEPAEGGGASGGPPPARPQNRRKGQGGFEGPPYRPPPTQAARPAAQQGSRPQGLRHGHRQREGSASVWGRGPRRPLEGGRIEGRIPGQARPISRRITAVGSGAVPLQVPGEAGGWGRVGTSGAGAGDGPEPRGGPGGAGGSLLPGGEGGAGAGGEAGGGGEGERCVA